MRRRPLVVVVSGAPGSGKTTLASRLAHYINVPHVERDKIAGGMEYTQLGERVDRVERVIPAYYALLASMINTSMSLVTDGTMYRGVSEVDIKQHLVSRAVVVNMHTRAQNEKQRFYDREMTREGRSSDWVHDHMKRLDAIYRDTVDPLDLGVPLIEVDTNDEYRPSLAQLVEKLMQIYREELI